MGPLCLRVFVLSNHLAYTDSTSLKIETNSIQIPHLLFVTAAASSVSQSHSPTPRRIVRPNLALPFARARSRRRLTSRRDGFWRVCVGYQGEGFAQPFIYGEESADQTGNCSSPPSIRICRSLDYIRCLSLVSNRSALSVLISRVCAAKGHATSDSSLGLS